MAQKKQTNKDDSAIPAFVQELKENGRAVLTAKSREELAEMLNQIPADIRYMAGAVDHSQETGIYSLRIDINN